MNRGRTHFESGKFAKVNNDTSYWGVGEEKKTSSQIFHVPFSYKNIVSLPNPPPLPTPNRCPSYQDIDKNINFPHACSSLWMAICLYPGGLPRAAG